jgi:hypothetical protein
MRRFLIEGSQRRYPNVYMSLSTGINFRTEAHRELIKACADDRILVESDIHRIDQCTPRTWAILCRVAEVKGWDIEQQWNDDNGDGVGAVQRLERNWMAFEKAGFMRKEKRKARKKADVKDADVE